MVKARGRGGQKRKSARILALEDLKKAKKHNNNPSTSNTATPTPQRKGRKSKRLDEVAVTCVGTTTQQNGEKPKDDVPSVNDVVPSSTQQMPDKRVLEFVLDILQRRDTHEIFAQPVDPDEVEGYYSIIENPMDFGTMRAKLQEGMYTSLEQFENDVFVISNNAMLFNSSATIYFRQARAIHELAKKVFHTLKNEPQNIELEFSLTRRRHGRKPRGEAGGSRVKLGARVRGNSLSGANHHGSRNGRNVSFCETEKRQTYKLQMANVESMVSTVYSCSKQLVPGNGGIGYKESLLRFVKDLGQTAWKVANQKLRFLSQTTSPSTQDLSHMVSLSAAQHRANCMDGVISGPTVNGNNPMCSHGARSKGKEIVTGEDIDINSSACRGNTALGIGRLDIPGAVSKGKGVLTSDSMDPYGGACGGKTALADGVNFQGALHGENLPCGGIMGTLSALRGERAHDTYRNAVNRALSRVLAAETGPLRAVGENSSHQSQSTESWLDLESPTAGSEGFKYMDLLQGAIGEDIAHHNQNSQNQFCSYPPSAGTANLISQSTHATGDRMLGCGLLGDQMQREQLVPKSQSGFLEFLPSSNRRPKSCVHPSKVIQPSGSSQSSASLQKLLALESNAPLDLNRGASLSQENQPLEWNRPTSWGPQAIQMDRFMQQEPQLTVHQYLQPPLSWDVFARQQSQDTSAAYMQGVNPLEQNAVLLRAMMAQNMQQPMQPNEANTFGHNAYAQRGLQLSPTPYVQPQQQPSLLNLLGQEVFVQPEPQLPVVPQMQPLLNELSLLGQNVILPPETQFGLPNQGLMLSDGVDFRERALLQGQQGVGNGQFWDFRQQSLVGSQLPDLDLRLLTQNRRL